MDILNLTRKHLRSVKQSAVSDHLLECNCLNVTFIILIF